MRILVLAGGFDQIALINGLKDRGHKVILADYLENPPAKRYVDKFWRVSTLDEQKIYELAKMEKVDLVTTVCTDQALLTMANVSKRLDLPCYINPETAKNVTNKAYMKKIFSQYQIPTASWHVLERAQQIEDIEDTIQFPCIVKPCDCNSSKGVEKILNHASLKCAVKNAFDLSRSKRVIIEEYIEGKEISVDAWVTNGKVEILSVSETKKMPENESSFTIYQSKYPAGVSQNIEKQIEKIAQKICLAFGLKNCPLLIQAITNTDKLYIVEFSARMGGGSKYKLIEYMSGVPIMNRYIDLILQIPGDGLKIKKSDKYYELDYLYTEPGCIQKFVNFQHLYEQGDIKEIFQYKTKGSMIERRDVSSDRSAGILLEGIDEKELMQKRKYVLNKLAILDEHQKDILYRSCFFHGSLNEE